MALKQELIDFLFDETLKDEFENLTYNDSLLERGIIDSVKMLDLIAFIEERYQITVAEEDMYPDNFDTISAIEAFIQSKKK